MTPKDTKKMQAKIEKILEKGQLTKGSLTTLYQAGYSAGYKEGKKHVPKIEKVEE